MKKLVLIILVILIGCSTEEEIVEAIDHGNIVPMEQTEEEPEAAEEEEEPEAEVEPEPEEEPVSQAPAEILKGKMIFTSEIADQQASRGPVPLCTGKEPATIRYTLQNAAQEISTFISEVAMNGNLVTSTEPVELAAGIYTITDLTLFDANGEQTHSVPDVTDETFSQFTNKPTPFPITITAGEESDAGSDIMCWTGESIFTTIGGNTVTEIRVLNMYLTPSTDGFSGCIEELTVDLYWKGNTEPERIYHRIATREETWLRGEYIAPVPVEIDSVVASSWTTKTNPEDREPFLNESFTFTKDNFPSQHISDVVYFRRSCN